MQDDIPERPKFLSAQDPETWQKPDDVTWGEYSFNPSTPLTPRAREVCRLLASGLRQKEVAEKLKMTQPWVSRIATSPKGRREIERFQDRVFEKSVAERVRELGNPAIDVIEEILTSDDPSIKPSLKADLAKWVAEKISGKAKQEVEVGGSVLVQVLDQLQSIRETGQIIDVGSSQPKAALEAGQAEQVERTERENLDAFLDAEFKPLE